MQAPFFEKQDGALCAQHALNALLQGAYFSAVDLAELARSLDELERQRMAESGLDSKDYLAFMAADSNNYDDSGFFSSQVLSKALEVWNLEMIPVTNPAVATVRSNPSQENAYICWLQQHWFTLRKIDNVWYNLDSRQEAPQRITDLYLGLIIDQLITEGYTIFVIRGNLPAKSFGSGHRSQMSSPNADNDEDFQRALQESLKQSSESGKVEEEIQEIVEISDTEISDEQKELEMAIALSLQSA
eukprot:m.54333 g.54333  ORF g.54333 m.54333 type:complete len:244 (-) comp10918_c0_seq2:49-780(-)